MTLALVGVGCHSDSLVARDGGNKTPGPDGSADPAACGCQVAGDTLTISMACYCAQYDCTQSPSTLSCSDVSYGVGCGILEVSGAAIGGSEEWVFNDERSLIGVQRATDGAFACPTDPSLQGRLLRAGAFPLEDGGVWFDGCTSVTKCPCVDGTMMGCPAFDAGTSTTVDATAP